MTALQKQAANPSYNVWVSASAGTGKTKVLTDRVLRLMLNGVEPAHIFCLTFTTAAAQEMKQRISQRLSHWVTLEDELLSQEIFALTEQSADAEQLHYARRLFAIVLELPNGLPIQTIHAFCQSILQQFPVEAGIAPNFQLIEPQTSSALLHESYMDLLTELTKEDSSLLSSSVLKELKAVMDSLSWRLYEGSFSQLLHEVIGFRHKISRLFHYHHTLGEITHAMCAQMDMDSSALLSCGDLESLEAQLQLSFYDSSPVEDLKSCIEPLQAGSKTDNEKAQLITDWLESNTSFEDYKKLFLTATDELKKSLLTKKVATQHPNVEKILQVEQQRIAQFLEHLKSYRTVYLTRSLLMIAQAIIAIYETKKQQRAYLDFDDLIVHTHRLFSTSDLASWILYKMDGRIDHVLVDEAQDTSLEQWELVEMLCEEFFAGVGSKEEIERTLFVVGDEKQSIYSFQGAEPKLFVAKQHAFKERIDNAGKPFHTIPLNLSFRSTKAVLEVTDQVFAHPDLRASIAMDVDSIKHEAHRLQEAGKVALWPLIEEAEEKQEIFWPIPDSYKQKSDPAYSLADRIAKTIAGWIQSKRILKAKGRPIQPGDIMILLRKRGTLSHYLVRALKQYDIPTSGIDRIILNDHIAVMDLIALAEFMLYPEDDLTLATVLKTPLIGLDEETLFALAYDRGTECLWQQLVRMAKTHPKIKEAYDYLQALMPLSQSIGPYAFYYHVIDVLDGRKLFSGRLGNEVQEVFDAFLSLTSDYEQRFTPSLQGFIQWFKVGYTEIKKEMETTSDEVRIMTVHASKGLQAPIVFLPDTTSVPQNRSSFIWDPHTSPSLFYWLNGKEGENHYLKSLRAAEKQEALNEYYRLLYVALTRAEDELYIAGYQSKQTVPINSWYEVIKRAMAQMAEMDEHGHYQVVSEQHKHNVPASKEDSTVEEVQLPDYFTSNLSLENARTKHYTPSTLDTEVTVSSPLHSMDETLYQRGRIIHSLLQYIAAIDSAKREEVIVSYMRKQGDSLTKELQEQIKAKILTVMEREAWLFAQGSKAEVAITGKVGQHIVNGQIDRLVIRDDAVYIIDYKTNRNPPTSLQAVPKAYVKQMAAYRQLVQKIYADKHIHCGLLWVENATLMLLDDAMISSEQRDLVSA